MILYAATSTIIQSSIAVAGIPKRKVLSLDSTNSGRAALVVFQQNEEDLLADWISYHGRIFGFASIYVIDHNSTSLPVLNFLSFAERLGVTIIPFDGPFVMKHQLLTDTMHGILDKHSDVDMVIPLDVDEFIVARDVDAPNSVTYTTSPSMIIHHLGALPRDGFKYKFGAIQAAACRVDEVSLERPHHRRVQSSLYFGQPNFNDQHKTFFGRQGFISTDQGNHVGKAENDVLCEELANLKQHAEDSGNHDIGTMADDGIASTFVFAKTGKDCFHQTALAVVHYGIFALSFTKWRQKKYRGARAYGFRWKDDHEIIDCGRSAFFAPSSSSLQAPYTRVMMLHTFSTLFSRHWGCAPLLHLLLWLLPT